MRGVSVRLQPRHSRCLQVFKGCQVLDELTGGVIVASLRLN